MTDEEILKAQLVNIEKYVTEPLIRDLWTDPNYHRYYLEYLAEGDTHDIADTKARKRIVE